MKPLKNDFFSSINWVMQYSMYKIAHRFHWNLRSDIRLHSIHGSNECTPMHCVRPHCSTATEMELQTNLEIGFKLFSFSLVVYLVATGLLELPYAVQP